MIQKHHIVKKAHPRLGRRFVFGLLVLGVLSGGGWALFDYGRYRAGFDSEATLQQITMLELRIQSLSQDGQRLRERIAVLDHGKEIDKAAYAVVAGDLKVLQDELHELRQQLNFYQGIVSPADTRTGVRVQSMKFLLQAEALTYQYKLILIQGPKRARRAAGRARVFIHGSLSGNDEVFAMEKLHIGEPELNKYRFMYFQEFQGVIKIPAGFEPREVVVKLTPDGRNPKVVEEQYSWDTLVN